MGRLTEALIQQWIAIGQPVAKSDGDGLTFTLSPAGTPAWILRYRQAGKQREITLGRYPDIPLSQARTLADTMRDEVRYGIDVAAEKQISKMHHATATRLEQLTKEVAQARRRYERAQATAEMAKARLELTERELTIEQQLMARHGQSN